MKNSSSIILVSLLLIPISKCFASNAAEVVMLRGQATLTFNNKPEKSIKLHDQIPEGGLITTKEKSLVKLSFIDNSQVNIGPSSQMAVNKFKKGEAGLISLIKGEIRSHVTKEENKEADKSKLLIKTKSAAMGIRGTDFHLSYNPQNNNTALLTFEGNIAFAQINEAESVQSDSNQLELIVSDPARAVAVTEGLYSGVTAISDHASIPIKPSNVQISQLKENENFEAIKTLSKDNKVYNSPVPPGISSKLASNDNSDVLETEVRPKVTNEKLEEFAKTLNSEVKATPTEGFVDDSGHIAPVAGGYIDMKTAIYIAPPPKSLFDHNTGLYVPPPNYGTVDVKGSYQPPEGLKLTPSGEFIPDGQNRENKNLVPSSQDDALNNQNKAPVLMPLSVPMTGGTGNREIASTTAPTNDVLNGGFFIPGNYFIDTRPAVSNDPPPVNENARVHINVIQ